MYTAVVQLSENRVFINLLSNAVTYGKMDGN